MTLLDIFNSIDLNLTNIGWLLIIFVSIVQIAPIKINPWSWLLKKIKHILYGDISTAITEIRNDMDKDRAMASRYRIIRACDETRHGEELSDDHISQLSEDIDIYKKYCKDHPEYLNHKGQASMRYIEEYERKKSIFYNS